MKTKEEVFKELCESLKDTVSPLGVILESMESYAVITLLKK
jgi:hypothetical protein